MKKVTRTINLILEIDWEDYEEVDEQLILEDAIREVADGVRISITSKNLVQPDVAGKTVCDHPQTARTYWQGETFCVRCQTIIKQ